MYAADSAGKLIIACGLPGSGKTTHARQFKTKLRALRLCADEWMSALSIDIWDETRREQIKQWSKMFQTPTAERKRHCLTNPSRWTFQTSA